MRPLRWQVKACFVRVFHRNFHASNVFDFLVGLIWDAGDATGNILGTVFPLFSQHMYNTLTYKWANTLFALISVAMIPIPYVSTVLFSYGIPSSGLTFYVQILFFYGAEIRKRSRVSSKILALIEEKYIFNAEKVDKEKGEAMDAKHGIDSSA